MSGPPLTSPDAPAALWFARVLGSELGPMPYEDLKSMVARGELNADDDVRLQEWDDWVRARDVVGLIPLGAHRGSTWTAPSKPAPATITATTPASAGARDNYGRRKSEPEPEWYCEVLGAELGPMSFDDLFAMGANGELSATDRVKFGASGEWQTADQIPGLIPAGTQAAASAQPALAGGDHRTGGTAPPVASTVPAIEPPAAWYCQVFGTELGPLSWDDLLEMVRKSEVTADDLVRCGTASAWKQAADFAELAQEFPPAIVVPPPAPAPAPPKPMTAAVAAPPQHAPPTLDQPAPARTDATVATPTQSPPAVAAPAAAAAPVASAPVAAPATTAASAPPMTAPPPPTPAADAASSTPPPAFDPNRPASPLPQYFPVGKSPLPHASGGGFSLGEWRQEQLGNPKLLLIPLAILLVIGAALLWRSAGNPQKQFDTLSEIYAQHQQLRKEKAEIRKWKELQARIVEEVGPIVRDLEKHAGSDDPLRQHLLWAGRDYLPTIVKEGQTEKHPLEEKFKEHMEKAKRYLAGEKPPPPVSDERENAPLDVTGER